MATLEDRFQTVADYVETYTGRPTFEADSNFTQPDEPYNTVKLINESGYQHDTKEDIDGITEEVRGLSKLTYSIQSIGGDASAGTGSAQILKRLKSSFNADVPRRVLTDEKIGILEIGNVIDISAITHSEIEDRSSLTITLSASIAEIFDYESSTETQLDINAGLDPVQTVIIPDEPDCPV